MNTKRFFEPQTWDGKLDKSSGAMDFSPFDGPMSRDNLFAEGRCYGCGALIVFGLEEARVYEDDKPADWYMCAWCVDHESTDPDCPEAWRPMFQYGHC